MKKKKLYLYLVTPKEPVHGYDIYRKFVVVAELPKAAKGQHPAYFAGSTVTHAEYWLREAGGHGEWVKSPSEVTAKCIGTAARGLKAGQIICSDYLEG